MNVANRQTVSADQAAAAILETNLQPGKLGAVPIPPFLVALVEQQLVQIGQQYGPQLTQFAVDAATKTIQALAEKFHLSPK